MFGGNEERPISNLQFFEDSLSLARQMHRFVFFAEAHQTLRNEDRDAALEAWKGVYGDDFRQRAIDEDQSFFNAAATIKDDAIGWSKVWLRMVNNQNRYQYGQAYDAQQKYIKDKEESFWKPSLGDGVALVTGGPVGYLGKQAIDYMGGGSDDTFSQVPEPQVWRDPDDLPKPPDFFPFYAPFISYSRDGDNLVATYVDSPPAPYSD